jgi:plasmid stabilization system protein ParE
MIRIRISDDALRDFNEGFLFYEAQQEGLGDYFVSSLKSDIEGLKISAGSHRVVHRDYHRLLSRVFPHAIFYTLSASEAVIWAVIDLRRDPAWIRSKLGEQ